jgi:thiamine kinase-like enzyme
MKNKNLSVLAEELMFLFSQWKNYFNSIKTWDKETIKEYKKLRDKYNKKEEEFLKSARSQIIYLL